MDGFLSNHQSMESDEICILTDDALTCDLCLQYKINIKAEGYCSDCRHHLCGICFEIHLKPIPTRHHKLLDKREMPMTKTLKDECTDKCNTHKDKTIKYYCETHRQLGCTVCITLGHRTCNVGYIPTLSENLFQSSKYQEFNKRLDSLCRRQQSWRSEAGKTLVRIDNEAGENLEKVRKFRNEVDKYFDEIEAEIKGYIMKTTNEKKKNIKESMNKCDALGEQLNSINTEIDDKVSKSQKCRLFVDLKRFQESTEKIEICLLGLERTDRVKYGQFKPSKLLEEMIKQKSEKLGSLDYDSEEGVPDSVEAVFTLDTERVCRGNLQMLDSNTKGLEEGSIDNENFISKASIGENYVIVDDDKEPYRKEFEWQSKRFNFELEVQHLGNIPKQTGQKGKLRKNETIMK